MYDVAQFPTKYFLDIDEALLSVRQIRKVFETMQDNPIEQMLNSNIAMDRLQKHSAVDYGYVSPTTPQAFTQKDHTDVSKLARREKRKLLAALVKAVPIKQMTYEQARLYHRLRGRM